MSKITHQAIEYLPYRPGQPLTRAWSKWDDGRITHSDSVSTCHETPHGTMFGTMFVNIGADRDMPPPSGLKWIDTCELG